MAESWFSPFDFVIDGKQGGALAGGAAALGGGAGGSPTDNGGSGGGWSLDVETAREYAKIARENADAYGDQAERAARLARTQSPSEDFATIGFNKHGNQAWDNGATFVRAERDFWASLADALEKALGNLQGADEGAGHDVGKAADQDNSGGGLIS